MTWWPKKIKRPKMGVRQPTRIDCPGHRAFVKRHRCCLEGRVDAKTGLPHVCKGPTDPHHSTTRGAGGGDETCVPICRGGHDLLDSPGWSQPLVEERFGVCFAEIAAKMAGLSDPLKRYLAKRKVEQSLYGEAP